MVGFYIRITELTHRIRAEPMFVLVRPYCTPLAEMANFAQQAP